MNNVKHYNVKHQVMTYFQWAGIIYKNITKKLKNFKAKVKLKVYL